MQRSNKIPLGESQRAAGAIRGLQTRSLPLYLLRGKRGIPWLLIASELTECRSTTSEHEACHGFSRSVQRRDCVPIARFCGSTTSLLIPRRLVPVGTPFAKDSLNRSLLETYSAVQVLPVISLLVVRSGGTSYVLGL